MSTKSPLAVVNEKFGGKDKLVGTLVSILESDEPKEELRQRLLGVANTKLLRLHRVATVVKEKYGSRDKLVAQTAAALGRSKDKDYVARLESHSTARLVDFAEAAARRTRRLASAVPTKTPVPAAKKTRAKKAKAPKGE